MLCIRPQGSVDVTDSLPLKYAKINILGFNINIFTILFPQIHTINLHDKKVRNSENILLYDF